MPVNVFFCYDHEDEAFLNKLKMHLSPLQREGLIDIWYDREISAGAEKGREIDKHLNSAHIILLLVSPAFMNSDYCYSVELARAIERHVSGEACVVPIILRPIDWHNASFGNLKPLPKDGQPVTDWSNRDKAFLDIARGIRKVVEELNVQASPTSRHTSGKTTSRLPNRKNGEHLHIGHCPYRGLYAFQEEHELFFFWA
jgi:hypothetical protein